MIRLSDAMLLAYTKLRTRRIRTGITVAVSGLLFAVLVAILVVARGAENSIHAYMQEGLNDRYIVSTSPDQPTAGQALRDPTVIAQAEALYKQTVAAKKAAATKLGISYDPSTGLLPVVTFPGPANQQITMLNVTSPAAQKVLGDYATAHPAPGLARFKMVAAPYHPIGLYETTTASVANGTLSYMKNGNETFNADQANNNDPNILQTTPIEKAAPQLADPFLLPPKATTTSASDIPVIVPYSKAEKLLGLAPLAANATAAQKLARIKKLYAIAGDATFSACYRNSISEQQIQTAINQAQASAAHAGNKNYQKPDLVYGLPQASSCGPAVVVSDTRTSAQKALQAKQDTFTKMFGGIVKPVQQKLTFRIVGLTPDPQSGGSSTTLAGLLQNVVGSSLGSTLIIPRDMLNRLPNVAIVKQILFPTVTDPLAFSPTNYYAEFGTAQDARNFINNISCTTRSDGACATPSRPFQLTPFGGNSIALEDLQRRFAHYFVLALLGTMGVAAVVMGANVGRMIADGRRETAVFRAIGARRLDIVVVYGMYTLCLALLVAIFALVVGFLISYSLNAHFWQGMTVQAQLLFGASDMPRRFRLLSAYYPAIGGVLLAVLVCAYVGMLLPVIRNVRRSPIKDMREE